MDPVLRDLFEQTQRLLLAIQAGTDEHRLAELLGEREQSLGRVLEALAGGMSIAEGDRQDLRALEGEVAAALGRRRDLVLEELVALQRGRAAGSRYGAGRGNAARYLDRRG
jgi:hypothetical protein